jgi:hypothetical protein
MSFSFNKGAKDMESLNELIYLVSVILDGGFDLQGFSDWKELSFLTLLSLLLGPFQFYTLGLHRLIAPNPLGLLCGVGLFMAAEERLFATAIAFKANQVPSSGHTSLAPRDLSARRNF